jgi:hypothetical protein
MAYFVSMPAMKGAPGDIDTAAKNPVLAEAYDAEGNKYVYLKGVANTVAGSWVTFDEAGVTALIDTDVADSVIGPVAIAIAATIANTYGWYGRKGTFSGVSATIADNAKVFPTSTAGQVDDTSVAGSQIVGAKARSADSGGLATFQINDPWIGVNVA